MNYRRNFIAGGSFFFTQVTANRAPVFTTPEAVDALRLAFARTRIKYPFYIDAAVILPDHLHCIWTLPPGDANYSVRWRLIKTAFTKAFGSPSPWQKRYWEHTLRDNNDFNRHIDYIHFNPVKHGYVTTPGEWPYSSFQRYVKAGILPPDWAADVRDLIGVGRE